MLNERRKTKSEMAWFFFCRSRLEESAIIANKFNPLGDNKFSGTKVQGILSGAPN